MIYGKLMGGLGNQLFIYSFCKRLVYETGQKAKLIFPGNYIGLGINAFQLDANIELIEGDFSDRYIENELINEYEKVIRKINILKPFFLNRACAQYYCNKGLIYNIDEEIKCNINKISKNNNIIFTGYFQNPIYFHSLKNEIKREINTQISKKIIDKINAISEENSVCVHIRRGDYLWEQYKNKFYVCKAEYYKKAIEKMYEYNPTSKFYIFSDGLDGLMDEMPFLKKYQIEFVNNYSEEKSNIADFMMMKECRHFILSNSSYSWWAQYLSENENKIVIAPSRWYNDNSKTHLYQKDWSIIDV